MSGEKVKQLSQMFDAPQYAQQFMELARKTGKCRDLRIRAKCEITGPEGKPVINKKTKMPKVGWTNYTPEPITNTGAPSSTQIRRSVELLLQQDHQRSSLLQR